MSTAAPVQFYPCIALPPGNREDVYELQAIRMAVLHNIMIRAINSIIAQVHEVQPNRLQAFMKYCLQFAEHIHKHHAQEETLYFVMLEEKLGAGAMGHNFDAHKQQKGLIKTWEDLCNSIKDGKTPLNPDEFIVTTRAFADVLIEHLREELSTLRADDLRKACPLDYMQLVETKMNERGRNETSLMWDTPFDFVNNEVKTSWFPPMPSAIQFVVRNVMMPLHSDVWEFGSTDKNGNLKPRYASAEASSP